MKKVELLLDGKAENHLYPFFWQHGESKEILTDYMEKIYSTGIRALCIESRPHPDFLENGWWETMDHILYEAKRLGMKLWILDDARFPTGYANGKVPEHLKKVYLNYHRFDFVGPKKYAEINLRYLPGFRALMKEDHSKDVIEKVIMVKNIPGEKNAFDETSMLDVTPNVKDGILHIDLPEGYYSFYVLYSSRRGGEQSTEEYLNPMSKEATTILLNEVYEKHYLHYKDEFGKTIVGFFSDEPRFGNTGRSSSIGRDEMPLPWREDMLEIMHQRIPNFDETHLVFLFSGKTAQANKMRFEYMNVVSNLYSENFSQTIGAWCKERGVDYVGHIIEDNNADARLGKGAGHFFRAMKGQSIAGIDVIGGQLIPGMPFHHDAYLTGGSEGEFFHYALTKLGASLAKLDPNKNGTLMCEAFGAYGWVEGLRLMKWITDHLLSHGVNLIVPHAFDPKEFPDWDCPPHFYAHGNNPQFPYFHHWVTYANRMCTLLSGGYQVSRIGVLYHAFSEWSGEYMFTQKVLKELANNQIDCNIISEDYLLDCDVRGKKYVINEFEYDVLVVPYSQYLPKELIGKLNTLSSNGISVIYINDKPQSFEGDEIINKCVVSLDELSNKIKDLHYNEVSVEKYTPSLTYYHYKQPDGNVYMFFNESVNENVQTKVVIPSDEKLMIYDAYYNKTYALSSNISENNLEFYLSLEPYQSLVLVSGESTNEQYKIGKVIQELKVFDISMKSYKSQEYRESKSIKNLEYLGNEHPYFSGELRYSTNINCEDTNVILKIDNVYETVRVVVNDKDCTTLIAPPYIFDLSEFLVLGENKLEIYVINTLNRNLRDMMSMYIETDPLGIVGPVTLNKKI